MCVSGNSSQYTGLIHAAIPEHTVATGGSIGACGGGDALPTRPVQVQQDVGLRVWLAVLCMSMGWLYAHVVCSFR